MVRQMTDGDWERVEEIFKQGIEHGTATVLTDCPTFVEWDGEYLPDCRLVEERDGKVVGWTAIRPTSTLKPYWGVAEVSIYVDDAYQRQGVGTSLLHALFAESEKCGYWTLYAAIFSHNEASVALHRRCGFRVVGRRERIVRDRFGVWRDTIILERRRKD